MVCSVQCSICSKKCTCSDSGALTGAGAVRDVHCAVCKVHTAVSRAGGYRLFKLISNRPGDHIGL